MKIINILLLLTILSGCAGIGLMATNDPYRKLIQADILMAQDRALMAEDRVSSALKQFEKEGNESGTADAYHAFGNLYKSDTYHRKWSNYFKKAGTYDGTYMKSIENFEKAIELFEKTEDETGIAPDIEALIMIDGADMNNETGASYTANTIEEAQIILKMLKINL